MSDKIVEKPAKSIGQKIYDATVTNTDNVHPDSPLGRIIWALTGGGGGARDAAKQAISKAQGQAKQTIDMGKSVLEEVQEKAKAATAAPVASEPTTKSFGSDITAGADGGGTRTVAVDAAATAPIPSVLAAEATTLPEIPAPTGSAPAVAEAPVRGRFSADIYARARAHVGGDTPALTAAFEVAKQRDTRLTEQVIDHANRHAADLTDVKLDEPRREVATAAVGPSISP